MPPLEVVALLVGIGFIVGWAIQPGCSQGPGSGRADDGDHSPPVPEMMSLDDDMGGMVDRAALAKWEKDQERKDKNKSKRRKR